MELYLKTIIVLWTFDQTFWSCCMDHRDSDFKLSEQIQVGWLVRETDDRYIIALEQIDNHDVKHTVAVPKCNVQAVKKYKYSFEGGLVEQDKD